MAKKKFSSSLSTDSPLPPYPIHITTVLSPLKDGGETEVKRR